MSDEPLRVHQGRGTNRRGFIRAVAGAAVAPWLAGAFAPVAGAPAEGGPDTRDAVAIVVDDLVAAGHILSNETVIDAFGHVSGRHPTRPTHFLMSRARPPGLSEPSDIMEFDVNGDPVDAQGRHPYLERFIHAAVYEARPDVRSVVHDHSREVLPFSVSRVPLRPVGHTGGVIGETVPVWDVREHFGDRTNMLVSSLEMGRDLARRMGKAPTLLMRGHGAVIAAKSIRLATFTAIGLDTQARALREALTLGAATGLSSGEAAATAGLFDPDAAGNSIGRAWEYWCARANVPYRAKGA